MARIKENDAKGHANNFSQFFKTGKPTIFIIKYHYLASIIILFIIHNLSFIVLEINCLLPIRENTARFYCFLNQHKHERER